MSYRNRQRNVRLRAPQGTDEANHGTERFRVDNDGTITVPAEAAPALLAVGGFSEITDPVELPSGTVRMTHHDETAACSYRGEPCERLEDGSLVVPIVAVAELAAHGFTPVVDEPVVVEA